jgi:hypothetical protein
MKPIKLCGIISLLFLAFILFACGGGGGSGSSIPISGGGVGTLSLSLTDEMSNTYQAIYVTLEDVQVHAKKNGNGKNSWFSVSTPNLPKTFNLYDLTNGVREEIGIADLAVGSYTQMRMMIGTMPDNGINILSEAHPYANYVIDSDGMYQELKIPSGIQTGLKIVHGFTISADQTTELILDFLADKSVVVGGNGNWHIQPTVKVGSTEELSIIRGRVTTDGINGVEGALVSVQIYDGGAADDKDKVIIQTSTVTNENGYFSIFVSPLEAGDHYNLVIYDDGKMPVAREINSLVAGQTLTFPDDNIQLSDASTKNVIGTVMITGGDNTDQYASISFRQDIDSGEMIEVTSVDVLNTEGYSINLPVLPLDSYSIVAWTLGFDTKTSTLDVLVDDPEPIVENIDFP